MVGPEFIRFAIYTQIFTQNMNTRSFIQHLLAMAFLFFLAAAQSSGQKSFISKSLDSGWQMRQAGTDKWLPAAVPGTVHTDLMAAGIIPDPYFRLNEHQLQWIDKVDWEYCCNFELSPENIAQSLIRLRFEGLDTYAEVLINNHSVLLANNMFRSWTVDIRNWVKAGSNQLLVRFKSPLIKGLEKQEKFGFALPASNDQSENGGFGPNKVSIFTRKAGYHFGWDWGPRLVTSGIWRPVYLEFSDNALIERLLVQQAPVVKNKVAITCLLNLNAPVNGQYTCELLINGVKAGSEELDLKAGGQSHKISGIIENPELWWPNGLGGQPLYTITARLWQNGKQVSEKSVKTGIRSLKLVQKPDGKGNGESFFFEVNGRPVFAKGANYIPNDVFLPSVTKDKLRFIVESAAAANMNMVRVWGGGTYEDDFFYDLCDEYGIMVWQDFMYACSMYPGDSAFLSNARAEAEENIQRLSNHACLALWCGNNEIEVAWSQGHEDRGWGWKQQYNEQQRAVIWKAYDTLFHRILPSAVKTHGNGTPYWHSSPSAGLGKLADYNSNSGDMHYWGVWHGGDPVSDFRKVKGRFVSEYGFQSFPEFTSVMRYSLPGDYDIGSDVMKSHQRSGLGNDRILSYMSQMYQVPDDFSKLLYVGQLLQAEAIKTAIHAHRAAMPWCMGSLYWQLNDCWPVASWSGIDYYGKWKALHYAARDAFKSTILDVTYDEQQIKVTAVSDLDYKTDAILRLNLIDFSGLSVWNRSVKVSIPANNAAPVFVISMKDIPLIYNRNEVVLMASLANGHHEIDRQLCYFDLPSRLKLPDPELKTRVSNRDGKIVIELSVKKLCKNLMLVSTYPDIRFSDNFFDLLPGETRIVSCETGMNWNEFEKGFSTIHLMQTMH